MRARLVVGFRDAFSGGLGALRRQLDAIANRARQIRMPTLANIGAGLARGARQVGAVAAAAGALSFAGPLQQAAAFETQLRDIAITAGTTGPAVTAEVARMSGELQRTAIQWRESSRDLAGGLGVLIARGLEPERVRQYLPMLAEIRAASGAATEDLAQFTVALDRIAKIEGFDAMRQAMSMALRAGQLGGVELRDMARYFPGIIAQAGALGATGQNAVRDLLAMFEVMRDGFGTTEEAAAGFQQLLGHLLSEHTVKEMREFGVDMRRVYQNALDMQRRGVDINPVEALLQAIRRVVAAHPERIFQIMPDQNSRQAFQGLMAGLERFIDLRRQVGAATPDNTAQVARDRMQGLGAEMRLLQERAEQLGNRLGNALGANLGTVNAALAGLQGHIEWIDQRFPGAIDATIQWGGGVALLAGAVGLLAPVMGVFGRGLGLVMAPLRLVAIGLAGLLGLKVAAFIAIVAAIAGAAYLIYRYWGPISGFFQEVWDRIKAVWNSQQVQWLRDVLTDAFGAAARGIRAAWEGIREFFEWVWSGVVAAFTWAWDRIRPIADAIAAAARLLEGTQQGAGFTPEEQQRRRDNYRLGRANAGGYYAPEAAVPGGLYLGAGAQRTQVGGEIVVRAEPGTEVVQARPSNPNTRFIMPNAGRMLALP